LLYGATAGLGSIGSGQTGLARFAPSNFMGNLGRIGSFISGGTLDPADALGGEMTTGRKNIFQKALGAVGIGGDGKMGNIGKLATLGLVSKFLTDTLGMPPEQAEEELARDPTGYLEQYYRNLNPPTADTTSEEYEQQVREFVTTNTSEYAVGGRVGFADGPVLPPDPTQPVNPFGPKPPADAPVLPDRMASNTEVDKAMEALFEKYLEMGLSPEDAMKKAIEDIERMGMSPNKRIEETRGLAALGGKMDTASDNAMQAAGIEGLPVRQNPKGVKELDLRETGGFIQPVGIKEKEDDIPAMST